MFEMKIEIKESDESYHIYLNGEYLRFCSNYRELAMCIGGIIKASFKDVSEYK